MSGVSKQFKLFMLVIKYIVQK